VERYRLGEVYYALLDVIIRKSPMRTYGVHERLRSKVLPRLLLPVRRLFTR